MSVRPGQLARQIYADLVRRRSRVRITVATTVHRSEPPVFLVGPYRSGTTLLRYIVDSHSRFACPPESDFLAVLGQLVDDGRASSGLDSMGFDRDHVLAKAREMAEYFFGNYASSRGKPRWADKSPTYVDHLDVVRALFPDAYFVLLHRYPLDQIHSHTRGGQHTNAFIERHRSHDGEDPRLPAARYWDRATASMIDFADADAASLQLTYEDLCADPRGVTARLFDFLGEPWEESVLHYERSPHDLGMEAARTRASRGFRLSSGAYEEWPDDIRAACGGIVAATAQRIGYAVSGGDVDGRPRP